MHSEWLSPGVFSRQSRLSAKALRLYARDGVLAPSRVDPVTGYRQYHIDQLRDARLIRMLRRVGLPLTLVGVVMEAPRAERPAIVESFWADAERLFWSRRELVAHLFRTLPEGKDSYPMYEIKTREVAEQTVLTEQAYVDVARLRDWIVTVGVRQIEAANAIGGQVGPRAVIYHGDVSEDSDGPVEEILPIAPDRATESTLPVRVEPAHREAFVSITRAQVRYPDILSAYDVLERWIAENSKVTVGAVREVYFADPSEGPDDELVADIAFPIE